ncbi:alpha/beta fold hydrolase [Roseomonas sp. M0104]|uniref:Alpha/beta fold hydrolase n=1 Tax=Teichococcus coralli TaxID=2545983 RepID=A0A845BIA3_9PROT|nr:alpha/beta fold hydrolase [Pseudoroseomonas coralli]MXP65017.1 alpha/beta fold hydrolase [Pseudoroseomonas coralli]
MRPGEGVRIPCTDGVLLGGHIWKAEGALRGAVVVNPATGVLARYYHRYARFLARHGFDVLTYDYRGIGRSRPQRLRGCGYRWRDWGILDFDAALRFLRTSCPGVPLLVVGHSIGGFLPGYAESAPSISRILTVGAQYAYWRDYAAQRRRMLFLRWHVAMPLLTAAFGYFPGRHLGWLEDLPAGVANEWSFRGPRIESRHAPGERAELIRRFAAVKAPILAVATTDDEYATPAAVRRALSYYRSARRTVALLSPRELGFEAIGHFGLFHARHEATFWRSTLAWLRDGEDPWKGEQLSPCGTR